MAVTNEQVMAYKELVAGLARRYNGHHQAEYDDLYQEGMVAVFEAISKGDYPSKDIVAKRMRRWVSKCARHGVAGYGSQTERSKGEAELL